MPVRCAVTLWYVGVGNNIDSESVRDDVTAERVQICPLRVCPESWARVSRFRN